MQKPESRQLVKTKVKTDSEVIKNEARKIFGETVREKRVRLEKEKAQSEGRNKRENSSVMEKVRQLQTKDLSSNGPVHKAQKVQSAKQISRSEVDKEREKLGEKTAGGRAGKSEKILNTSKFVNVVEKFKNGTVKMGEKQWGCHILKPRSTTQSLKSATVEKIYWGVGGWKAEVTENDSLQCHLPDGGKMDWGRGGKETKIRQNEQLNQT